MYCIPTDIHKNIHTDTHWKLGCPHQYELLWPKPSIVLIARNTVRFLSHKLYPSEHEECLCLWLLAQSHNTLLWALTLDWKNEKAAKCQKTKCVFCSADPFLARPFSLPPPDSLWQVHFSGEIDPSLSFFHSFATVTFALPTLETKFTFTFQSLFFANFIVFIYLCSTSWGEIDPSPRSLSLRFNCDFWLTNPKTSLSHLNQNAPCSFWLVLIFDFLFSGEIDPSILSKCDLCFTDPCQNGASCRSLPNRDFECRSVETFYRLEPFYKRTYPAAPYPSCSCASGARRDSTGRRAQRWSTPATATRASTGPTAKCSRREDSCEWIPRPCHKVCQWEVLVGAKCGQRRARVSQVPLLRHRHPFSSPLSLYSLTSPYLYLYLCVIFQPSALFSLFSLFTH